MRKSVTSIRLVSNNSPEDGLELEYTPETGDCVGEDFEAEAENDQI